jgi:hypothetical protein
MSSCSCTTATKKRRDSRLLHLGETFYKVTGRLCVGNFDLLSERTSSPHAFTRHIGKRGKPSKINTAFFKCSLAFFESTLMRAYTDVNEPNLVYIEHLYFNQLRDVPTADFDVPPVLVGQQASTGKMYAPYAEDVVQTARSLL